MAGASAARRMDPTTLGNKSEPIHGHDLAVAILRRARYLATSVTNTAGIVLVGVRAVVINMQWFF